MLRAELLEAQQKVRTGASFPIILVFAGVDGAGKGETVNLLNGWLDPRWIVTRAYGPPSDEMAERPEYWRYWRDLPPKGRIGMFLGSWYSRPVLDRAYGRTSETEFEDALDRILAFEKALADDSALIVKFWMHLGKEAQKKRLQELESDPLTKWRVNESDWKHYEMFDQFVETAERAIMRTSRGRSPWHIVEGYDERYRSLAVGGILLDHIRRHFEETEIKQEIARARKAEKEAAAGEGSDRNEMDLIPASHITILSRLDDKLEFDKGLYKERLEQLQGTLNQLSRRAQDAGVSTILVFEGWDAAGKGGAIRRITAAMDARIYQVIPIQAPSDEENAQHYLWRFWRHLSRAGRFTIFDRSWYGRVLVERVEGFATEPEWRRAYAEINDFEDQLIQSGIVLCKFWLHISKDEQLARFKHREETPYKRWKLTDEDMRNRERWDAYEAAVNTMVERTSTSVAPWTLVEGNDKRYARVKILETVCDRLKMGLDRSAKAPEGTKKA